jgi:hypothetical protein
MLIINYLRYIIRSIMYMSCRLKREERREREKGKREVKEKEKEKEEERRKHRRGEGEVGRRGGGGGIEKNPSLEAKRRKVIYYNCINENVEIWCQKKNKHNDDERMIKMMMHEMMMVIRRHDDSGCMHICISLSPSSPLCLTRSLSLSFSLSLSLSLSLDQETSLHYAFFNELLSDAQDKREQTIDSE